MRQILYISRKNNKSGGGEMTFLNTITNNEFFKKNYKHRTIYLEGKEDTELAAIKVFDEYLFLRPSTYIKLFKNVKSSDIIHFNSVSNLGSTFLIVISSLLCRKIVVNFHSNLSATIWDKGKKIRVLRKYLIINTCLFFANKLIFITNYQLNEFKKYSILKNKFERKSKYIHNFIDEKIILNYPPQRDKIDVVFVGRLSKNKGKDVLLNVARTLPDVSFWVVGNDAPIDSFDLPNNVKFLGLVSNHETITYLKKFGILLFPSFDETFGLSILESMSQGGVAICSSLPQIEEWFFDGINGYTVTEGDVAAFSNKIKKLTTEIDIFKKMSVNNLHYSHNFSSNKKVGEYINVYNSLI